ncbi:leucine-rich repeat domain-containing protein [Opitutales bacterium]|nr:leucine-rich repeat domain-containing protein [Opitutales bacterium]
MKLLNPGILVALSLLSGCGNGDHQEVGREEESGDPTLMTKCEACGKNISKQARGCPRCGHPNPIYIETRKQAIKLDAEDIVRAKGGSKALAKIRKAKEDGETRLYLHSSQIRDLTPLADSTQLTLLSLYDNELTDLTPLAGLTELTELQLYGNQIKDLTSLAELKNLEKLFLSKNQIFDVTPLKGLTKLEELNLGKNQIIAISPLASLTNLTELSLEGNITTEDQRTLLKNALPNCKISF